MPKVYILGDRVAWISSSNGSTKRKEGNVVEVVKIGKRPCQHKFPALHKHTLGSSTRTHESYVVRANGKNYWPKVDDLGMVSVSTQKKPAREQWVMPDWMKPYEKLIYNTGGNKVEELVNDDGTNSNVFVNAPRALICCAVKSQVDLLTALHAHGLLKEDKK